MHSANKESSKKEYNRISKMTSNEEKKTTDGRNENHAHCSMANFRNTYFIQKEILGMFGLRRSFVFKQK